MKVLIIANACQWASWPAKIAAIKAFYAPLVELDIDIKYTDFTNIPTNTYPGTVTEFNSNGTTTDVPGTFTELDQTWFADNVGPLITGYDIAVFQTTAPTGNGLPLGVKFEELNGTWCCETFVPGENDSYFLPTQPGADMGVNMGNCAEIDIEHEISHALYSISGQTDNTHLYFYANNFSRVLTDIKLPNQSALVALYQNVIADLQEELGLIKQSQSTADMNTQPTAPAFPPMITKWMEAISKWEGANPELNNPGNLKLSTLTESWGATAGVAASDGGTLCKFPTLAAGQNALCNFLKLGCEDELLAFHAPGARTLAGFTIIYAGNPPAGYIAGIEADLGVAGTTLISTFLS